MNYIYFTLLYYELYNELYFTHVRLSCIPCVILNISKAVENKRWN